MINNQTNPHPRTPSIYDRWLIDALAKHPATAAERPAAAAHRAALINRASLYQLQAFLEDQRDIRLLNSQDGRALDSDLELAQARITAKLAALRRAQPAKRQ
jgi:hypothetical protein